MSYKTILTEVDGKVATITLNRPEVLNALNDQLMDELGTALLAFDADDNIGCIIITGSEKAFAGTIHVLSRLRKHRRFSDCGPGEHPVAADRAGFDTASNQHDAGLAGHLVAARGADDLHSRVPAGTTIPAERVTAQRYRSSGGFAALCLSAARSRSSETRTQLHASFGRASRTRSSFVQVPYAATSSRRIR